MLGVLQAGRLSAEGQEPVVEVPSYFRYNRGLLGRSRRDSGAPQNPVWQQAARVLLLQAVLAVLAALAATMLWGRSAGLWALAGGAVCFVPSVLFAAQLARAARRSQTAFAVALLLGELVKVGLMAVLFYLAYTRFGGVNAVALLLGFIAAIQGYFFALLIV